MHMLHMRHGCHFHHTCLKTRYADDMACWSWQAWHLIYPYVASIVESFSLPNYASHSFSYISYDQSRSSHSYDSCWYMWYIYQCLGLLSIYTFWLWRWSWCDSGHTGKHPASPTAFHYWMVDMEWSLWNGMSWMTYQQRHRENLYIDMSSRT